MIKNVCFFSEMVAKDVTPRNHIALISVSDGDFIDLPDWGDRILRLYFHDILGPLDGYVQFGVADAQKIINFLNGIDKKSINTIFVHCGAGISRSAAIALFIAEKFGLNVVSTTISIKGNLGIVNYKISDFYNGKYPFYNRLVYSTLMKVK